MTISEKNETFDVIIGDATAENTKTPFEAIVKTDEKNIQNEIITRYKNIGLIKPKDNGYKQIREKMSNFGLRNFNTINIITNN